MATPAQLRHRLPQAVMVSVGTQLPPHELVFAGQVQRLREVSQICPFPQFEFVWQPKTHWLLRGSQKWLGGHEPAVWVHVAGNC